MGFMKFFEKGSKYTEDQLNQATQKGIMERKAKEEVALNPGDKKLEKATAKGVAERQVAEEASLAPKDKKDEKLEKAVGKRVDEERIEVAKKYFSGNK